MARLAPAQAQQPPRPSYPAHHSTPIFHSFAAHSSPYATSSFSHGMLYQPRPAHHTPLPPHAESSRPKCPKKPSGSTADKRQAVQLSLEAQVQRTKSLFVPLCRSVPAPPPSSPVGRPADELHSAPTTLGSRSSGEMARQQEGEDYFGRMWEKEMEIWVEEALPHTGKQGNTMDVDQ